MDRNQRFAIYYAPEAGPFADAAANWLGWDLLQGCAAPQPALPGLSALPGRNALTALTAEPRKYGFHGTLKPPFRLATGVGLTDLKATLTSVAARLGAVEMPGLQMVMLDGFLAMLPLGDTTGLQALACEVMRALEPCRAALTEAEIARRKPDRLTPRQRELLGLYGYPYVMDEFQFHLTLSGPLSAELAPAVTKAAMLHFAGLVPRPFRLKDLCLCAEDQTGHFHLLHRYPLSA